MEVPADELPSETPGAASAPEVDGHNDDEMDHDDEQNGDMDVGFLGSLEPTAGDTVSELLLQQLGSSGSSYRREQRGAARRIVSEMYSPPRVTAELKRGRYRHLLPGFALDLTVNDPEDGRPWDFSQADKREKARKMRREQKPYVLIGSPMCTAFCTFQKLNEAKSKNPMEYKRAKIEAITHIDFMVELYYGQMEDGNYFLHEHPRYATSWQLDMGEKMLKLPTVGRSHADQCQCGAEARRGKHQGRPILKPTGFMSNAPEILRVFSTRCTGVGGQCSRPGGGAHILCGGIHAKDAAKYPRGLCRAMLKGVTAQLRADSLLKDGCYGIQVPDEDSEVVKQINGPAQGFSGRFRDDLTGQVLKDSLVIEARAQELLYFHNKGV